MSIRNQQIGWSQESKLWWEVLKKFDYLYQVTGSTLGKRVHTPNAQIGWRNEEYLLREIAKKIGQITSLRCTPGCVTPTTSTTTTETLLPRRCTFTNGPSGPGTGGFAVDKLMTDLNNPPLPPQAYNYTLLDFTVDSIQYAAGQTLSVTNISQVVFGTGLDGNTYMMNISDWMTSVSVATGAGLTFYDNMRVIDTPDISTSYTIRIQRDGPGGGGPLSYYYSSTSGFSIGTPMNVYGQYACTNL